MKHQKTTRKPLKQTAAKKHRKHLKTEEHKQLLNMTQTGTTTTLIKETGRKKTSPKKPLLWQTNTKSKPSPAHGASLARHKEDRLFYGELVFGVNFGSDAKGCRAWPVSTSLVVSRFLSRSPKTFFWKTERNTKNRFFLFSSQFFSQFPGAFEVSLSVF